MSSENAATQTARLSPRLQARLTGLVGVVVLASGSFSNFVASDLIVREDAVTTANNIVASEGLFRLAVVSSLIMMVAWLAYALLLFKLLRPADRGHAVVMVILVLLGLAVFMLNQVNLFAVLPLAADQRHDQMMLFLDLHEHGNVIAGIFFGLWLFPLGFLVFKSGYIPRVLGIFLVIGGFGYLILFFQTFLFPGAERALWTNPALLVTHLSELSLLLWLLIMGVNAKRWEERAAAVREQGF